MLPPNNGAGAIFDGGVEAPASLAPAEEEFPPAAAAAAALRFLADGTTASSIACIREMLVICPIIV
jgi:hypothetical protein